MNGILLAFVVLGLIPLLILMMGTIIENRHYAMRASARADRKMARSMVNLIAGSAVAACFLVFLGSWLAAALTLLAVILNASWGTLSSAIARAIRHEAGRVRPISAGLSLHASSHR